MQKEEPRPQKTKDHEIWTDQNVYARSRKL